MWRASETSKCTDRQARNNAPDVFFLVLSYSHVAYPDHAAYILDRFPAAVRAMAARCKLSFALRPRLAQENDDRIKVKTKETTNEKRPHSHTSSADAKPRT